MRRVTFLLSCLLLAAVGTMAAPLAISIGYGEPETIQAFATTMFIGAAVGTVGFFALRSDLSSLTRQEGIAVVALGWLLVCAIGSLPYVLNGILGPIDAWFECTSGFTGTGSSVIPDVEALPRGILFWRCFAHWLGAMGFLVAFVALFPLLGVGAMQLYKAEAPGLEVDRLRPRLSSTARALWIVYLILSVALTLLLLAGGMDWYDALCQMFGAIGTGGFSTRNTSIALVAQRLHRVGHRRLPLGVLDQLLALVGGARRQVRRLSSATRSGASTRPCSRPRACSSPRSSGRPRRCSGNQAIRDAFFTVVSLASTTGFVTADYEKWQPTAQYILFMLLFMGGCAGSTAGAMKVIRVQLFAKQAVHEFHDTVHPYAVSTPRLNGKPITHEMMRSVSAFMGLYLLIYVISVSIVSLTGMDFATALSGVATTMGGVGPGLAELGPYDNFLWVHPVAKMVFTFDMLAGRLELITLFIMLTPAFWRR